VRIRVFAASYFFMRRSPICFIIMQEGERIPAGWVEVLYAVRHPRATGLSFAVLVDGELAHAGANWEEAGDASAKHFPAVPLGRYIMRGR